MRRRHLALAPALALVVAACSGGGSTPSPSVAASSSPAASTAAQRIEVNLTDAFAMKPAEMTVKAGQPVTFVVTNTGVIEHEFYLGDEAMQAEQEQEMQSGEMVHDKANGVSLKPGEMKEFTYTFNNVGQTLAGCHFAGHYAAGMKATISVTE